MTILRPCRSSDIFYSTSGAVSLVQNITLSLGPFSNCHDQNQSDDNIDCNKQIGIIQMQNGIVWIFFIILGWGWTKTYGNFSPNLQYLIYYSKYLWGQGHNSVINNKYSPVLAWWWSDLHTFRHVLSLVCINVVYPTTSPCIFALDIA